MKSFASFHRPNDIDEASSNVSDVGSSLAIAVDAFDARITLGDETLLQEDDNQNDRVTVPSEDHDLFAQEEEDSIERAAERDIAALVIDSLRSFSSDRSVDMDDINNASYR